MNVLHRKLRFWFNIFIGLIIFKFIVYEHFNLYDIYIVLLTAVATVYANLSSVPVLNRFNFKDWKENILIVFV